jgi:CDP-diacylglycerol--glycerol-3-phosphate 3-phosphatidyltransferase
MTSSPIQSNKKTENETDWATLFNLPNQLTMARLILSVVFFVLLGVFDMYFWKYVGKSLPSGSWGVLLLNISIAVFILAACSDFLDGYLARKWRMVSTFGRIADPFVDKVFICGSFIFLIPITPLVQAWYVVVIIMREFLVSGMRSFIEARGMAFGAGWSGKLKMVFQSVTIPVVIFYRANFHESRVIWSLVIGLLSLTLFLTVFSCIVYTIRAISLLKAR